MIDNTALLAADALNLPIIPIFVFDQHQLTNKFRSNNCIQFLIESIVELQTVINVWTYYGKPWEVVKRLIASKKITHVFCNKDYTPYSIMRDKRIAKACAQYLVNFVQCDDLLLHDMNDIHNQTGKYYMKFTPYYAKAHTLPVSKVCTKKIKHISKRNSITTYKVFTDYGSLYTENNSIHIHGGRLNGLKLLRCAKHSDVKKRVYPEFDTTMLSPHNKFGTVSIREIYHTLSHKSDIIRQLYWRDFYYTQIYNNPELHGLHIGRYSDLQWDNQYFAQWKNGKTGIPIVDAGMRQLNETGWIHNRIRLIVAFALTKVLLVDWRLGERYFQSKLIDYDTTQNKMNWYWVSGEVSFANPYFRILNPISQTKRFDKQCHYTQSSLCHDYSKSVVNILHNIRKSVRSYHSVK